jgi:hypothetical protein
LTGSKLTACDSTEIKLFSKFANHAFQSNLLFVFIENRKNETNEAFIQHLIHRLSLHICKIKIKLMHKNLIMAIRGPWKGPYG